MLFEEDVTTVVSTTPSSENPSVYQFWVSSPSLFKHISCLYCLLCFTPELSLSLSLSITLMSSLGLILSLKLSISRSSSSFNSLYTYRVATSFISKIRVAKNSNHQRSRHRPQRPCQCKLTFHHCSLRRSILNHAVGTTPSETRGTYLTVTRGTHCHPGQPHSDLPIKHT